MKKIRKIYVEEGEMVEIRVVPSGEEHNATGFKERLYPSRHKILAKIGSEYIDLPFVRPFQFMIDGKPVFRRIVEKC
jgi:hypothetical protein